MKRNYPYPAVRPDLPGAAELQPWLSEIDANGWYSNFGPLARRLEARLLAHYGHGGETAVSCSSATAGLSAALLALGAQGPCLIPAFTFPATLGAVRAAGLDAVVMDVAPEDWTVAPDGLARAVAQTGARSVVLVAPFGLRRDFRPHLDLCRRLDVTPVVDNAAGLGIARPHPHPDLVEVFSLHATKTFGAGEGGMIFAPTRLDAALRAAMNFGLPPDPDRAHPVWGFNGKMSEYHAAVGLAQCDRIAGIIPQRQAFAGALRDLTAGHGLIAPQDVGAAPWQTYPVLMPDEATADTLVAAGARRGLEIRRYYAPSLSQWPGVVTDGSSPVSEDLSRRMCTLPVRRADAAEAGELLAITADSLAEALR